MGKSSESSRVEFMRSWAMVYPRIWPDASAIAEAATEDFARALHRRSAFFCVHLPQGSPRR